MRPPKKTMNDPESPLSEGQLNDITRGTIEHYDGRALDFWQGTRDHDVSQNIEALLGALGEGGPYRILDFGCGPGRDLLALKAAGHHPTGLDGAPEFCAMARVLSGCEVLHQDFLSLALPSEHFHGIFANASLFHVPSQELTRVLRDFHDCLEPGGVLFSSNPRGQNVEGWNGNRYGAYHDLDRWRTYVEGAGFSYLDHYYRPEGKPRAEQPWLASTWRKNGDL